ncbi:MAG: hypothetical protein DCO96_09160 [Fluviicola sp. XM-24bin1]|nr:MAG: hypothetical protein DCO96_09160 [Fluviicola sp. XM-24bin1]
MERIAQEFFSMRMMVVALFVFLVSIGLATFAETVYDTQTARLLIYDAPWFMILLLYLCAGMIANIFKYRMFRAEKIAILTFHLAFIVMIIGAAVTRFYGFDGLMQIREGATSDFMFSSDPYLLVEVFDEEDRTPWERKQLMSEAVDPSFEVEIPLKKANGQIKQNVVLECVDYKKNMIDSLVTRKDIKETALGFAISSTQPEFVSEGSVLMLGQLPLSYEMENPAPGIHVWKEGNKFKMKSSIGLRSLAMTELRAIRESGEAPADSLYDVVYPDSVITLEMAKLYNVQGQQFVLKEIKKNTGRVLMKSPIKDAAPDYLFVRLRSKGKVSEVYKIPGGFKRKAEGYQQRVKFAGLNFVIGYGSKRIPLPFKIKCEDFRLERYESSSQPSSYESDLVIMDSIGPGNVKRIKKNLFMNNVVDYAGYRVFQSAYDEDEKGTILSVNYDWWGTNISYLGYLLMGLGMVLALIAPAGRTRELIRKIKKLEEKRSKLSTIAILIAMSVGLSATAQNDSVQGDQVVVEEGHEGHNHDGHDHSGHVHTVDSTSSAEMQPPAPTQPPKQGKMYIMSEEHSNELASLLVHSDVHKRHMPLHTLCEQLLRKIHRGNTYKGYNAVQVIMGMHMNQNFWAYEKVIYVSSKGDLRKKLGVETYASYLDLFDEKTGRFKLEKELNKAFQKREVDRNEEEKQLIKLAEKHEIYINILSPDWTYMRILPKVDEDGVERWTTILNFKPDSEEFKVALDYFGALNLAVMGKGGYGLASDKLEKLKSYQREKSKQDLPSETVVDIEIAYNKMEIVKRAYQAYGLIGFVLLICFLFGLLSKNGKAPRWVRITELVCFWAAVLTTLYFAAGLVFRALISGHVPWSDGYEALLFISLVTVVIGLVLWRVSKVILAAACILAFFLLFVSSLNILDPEITKLQPVLKSYWLKIHVAIITGSYAPLGIGAMLGFVNLILYIARNESNKERLGLTIKQITYITEIVITIGVIMLTIGTFLGGVWANESWGRYWAWDPKETWALVAILAYGILLHLRFIPGVKDNFTFNAVSLWGYSTILFTFFGVNFYLVGLHSYANGEGLAEFPTWLSLVGAGFYLFTEIASFRNQMHKSKGGAIPSVYFIRKLSILCSLIVGVAIMMMIFKISPVATIMQNAGIILALIIVTTGIQYILGGRKGDQNQTVEIID